MKKLDIQKIRIDLLEHENFYYPIMSLTHKINSIIDHLEPVELPKEERGYVEKKCGCAIDKVAKPWEPAGFLCEEHGKPKETSLRDGEIKQTLMRKVVYDELFDGSKVRRLVYTTLTIPKLHGYLESQMNNGSVNIINWEEMCLLTGTPN